MDTRKSITDAMWLTFQPLFLSAVGLPATAYIIRSMGALGYGQWAIGTTLVGTVSVLASLGLRPLFVRRVAQELDVARKQMPYQFGLRGLLAMGAISVALILCVVLQYSSVVLLCTAITACGLLLTTLGGVIDDVLSGLQRFRTVAMINLTSGIVLTLLSVVAAWYGYGPIGIALAYFTGPFTSITILIVIAKRYNLPIEIRWSIRHFRDLLMDSRMVGFGFIIATIRDRVEHLLVPKLVGITEFGYFVAGTILADRLTIIPSGLYGAFFPLIARTHKNTPKIASVHVSHLIITTLIVCIPISLLIISLARPISIILFNKNYDICREIIQITMLSLPFYGFMVCMGTSLQAINAHNVWARISIISSLVSLLVSITLIQQYGLTGACISWVMRPVIGVFLFLPVFRRMMPSVLSQIPIFRIIICTLITAASLWAAPLWVSSKMTLNVPLTITFNSFLALVVYISVLFSLQLINVSQLKSLIGRH
ncbi:MAG: oligosaccharide flippase family protein [Proteobacteria bacterium]|nr:oligosaccharide flippase family protein [Pseudomonadota bacterium]